LQSRYPAGRWPVAEKRVQGIEGEDRGVHGRTNERLQKRPCSPIDAVVAINSGQLSEKSPQKRKDAEVVAGGEAEG